MGNSHKSVQGERTIRDSATALTSTSPSVGGASVLEEGGGVSGLGTVSYRKVSGAGTFFLAIVKGKFSLPKFVDEFAELELV